MKHLPVIELPKGMDGAYRGGRNYDNLAELLSDLRDGMVEYPTAEVTAHDEPKLGLVGWDLYLANDGNGNDRWWEFMMSIHDFATQINAPDAPPEWPALKGLTGRMRMVTILRDSIT